jgi:hypothetical protein
MLKNSKNGFKFTKGSFQPFFWAMLLIVGFHFLHISNFQSELNEGTFYEISHAKVATPVLTMGNFPFADLATFESKEKEEKSESESKINFDLQNTNDLFVEGFYQISGAANQCLKIPSNKGKAALYILFKNFRVHLA